MKWLFRSHTATAPIRIDNNCTSFNDLSNDLLFEIFDYLSYSDILLSFSNLNIYFNQLIQICPHCIDLRFHKYFRNNIRSLKVSSIDHFPLFISFESSQLRSLRALTLANLRSEQVLNILNNVPLKQIEYIYLGVCGIDSTTEMISTIQTRILALSEYRLRECHLKQKFCVIIDHLPEKLVALEYLQLVSCEDFFILSQLISLTPNLKSVDVSITKIHRNPLIENSSYIIRLSLRPHIDCSVEELTTFLRKCCPHLNKLIVQLYIYRGEQPRLLVNKDQWMKIFPLRLTYFHLKSLSSSSVHLNTIKVRSKQSPLRQNLCLRTSDIDQHYCQVIIDAPLIPSWTKQ